MRVTYHPHAEAELIEAAQYYESRVEGLGKRFLAESDQAVSLIREAPQRWRIVEADVRRYLMPHFPFAIYYRSSQDESWRSNITSGIQITGDTEPNRRFIHQKILPPPTGFVARRTIT
jgi:hypothetical protein